MDMLRYKENRKAVSERRQEKPSATLYRKILISWSSGFEILIFLYQIKDHQARFIVKEKYRNSQLQSLRYKENRKAVSERRQEKASATLYRKILISWASGFGILIFLYQIIGNQARFIVREKNIQKNHYRHLSPCSLEFPVYLKAGIISRHYSQQQL